MMPMQQLREQMAEQDPEYRRLLEEHSKRARRLKKEKLQLKDQMEARLRSRSK